MQKQAQSKKSIMKRKKLLFALCLVLFGTEGIVGFGQNVYDDYREGSECLSSTTLLSFLNLSSSEAFDRLDSMDFGLGDLGDMSDMVYDTIDYFALTYKRSIFFNKKNKGCYIILLESMDGLSNIVEYSITPKGVCNIVADLNSHNYLYNKDRSSYSGSVLINGQMGKVEIVVRQDYSLWVKCMRTDDVQEFIQRKMDTAKAVIATTTEQAISMAKEEQFEEAYALLDKMKDFYPPLNGELEKCGKSITKQREAVYEYRLSGLVELEDYPSAIRLCDTILSINPNNSKVTHIRELIYAQLSRQTQHYYLFRPESYGKIKAQLSSIVNSYVRQNPSADNQRLRMGFRLHTNKANESFGNIGIEQEGSSKRLTSREKERQNLLQQAVDSMASSPLIQPIVDNGIYIITHDSLSMEVSWKYSTYKIDGNETRDTALLVKKYIDSIEKEFFYHAKISEWERTPNGNEKVTFIPELPTKRIYTFSLTRKESCGKIFSDVYLIDFETTEADSWMPSLLIPGLGTYMQNAREDVISRAIPFFLFAGISIGGFIYQNHNSGVYREDATWGQQNVGRIVGYSAAGISTAIYFTDLFEAIGTCFKNAKRSKSLRKKLKQDHYIKCLEQDVPIIEL